MEPSMYEKYVAANVCYGCGEDLPGPARRDSLCWHCMDDRRQRAGYCRHGKWIGGSGIDYMCRWCEDGEDPPPPMPRQDVFIFGQGISIVFTNQDFPAAMQWVHGARRAKLTARCVRRA